MKKIILLALLVPILQLSIISALTIGDNGIDIFVKNNTIIVQSFTVTSSGKIPLPGITFVMTPVNDSLNAVISCTPFNITSNFTDGNITVDNYKGNCTYSVDYSKEIPLINVYSNGTTTNQTMIVDSKTFEDLKACLTDKATIASNLQVVSNDYGAINKTNELYVKCISDLATSNAQKDPLQTQINTLQKDKEDSKNTPWLYAAIAFVIGILGTLYYKGHIGGVKAKHPEDSYNRGQSA